MFEDTNQTTVPTPAEESAESIAGLNLLDDEDAIDTDQGDDNASEAEGAKEPAGDAGEQNTTAPNVYTAKYLGKEIPLDKGAVEAIATAIGSKPEDVIVQLQKGMNYDRVVEERDRLRNAEEFQIIDEYARLAGMDRASYLEMLRQNRLQAEIDAQRNQVAQQYPDAPPEILQELAMLRRQTTEAQQRMQAEEQRRKPWFELFERFPDARNKELPQEVLSLVASGMRPVEAWLVHQNTILKQQAAAETQNAKNKQTAIGSLNGDSGDTPKDPFLDGFFSRFGG